MEYWEERKDLGKKIDSFKELKLRIEDMEKELEE